MFKQLLKKFLFCLPPEQAHRLALHCLKLSNTLGFNYFYPSLPPLPQTIMGLHFPNPIGLAAGFDKNGHYIDALASLGFGFIEVGTITPQAQEGNPRPRLFRLDKEQAIINRMGFNNKGLDYLVKQLQKTRFKGILGINLGKNRDTPLEQASQDYVYGFHHVWPYASYVTINVSSPNTPELRNLQQGYLLSNLLRTLKQEQAQIQAISNKYVPLVVKIAPDLSIEALKTIAENLLAEKIDGVIATNTTISRDSLPSSMQSQQSGGLSGKPLSSRSTMIVSHLSKLLQDKIPIIASGGIVSEEDALEKLNAGAKLIQVYSGFIFQGPWWLAQLGKKIAGGPLN